MRGDSSFPGDRPAWLVPCLVVAVLICVVGSGAAILLALNLGAGAALPAPSATPALPPSATVSLPQATSTGSIPTATGAPSPLATGPTATAQAALTAAAPRLAWPAILSDTFDNNDNGWQVKPSTSSFGTVHWTVDNGAYVLDLQADQGIFAPSLPVMQPLTDFQLQVDITHVGGSSAGTYGAIIHADRGGDRYYISLDSSGAVDIALRHLNEWKTLVHRYSPAVHRSGPNRLLVDVVGPQIDVFVNGEFAAETSDDTLHSGLAGVAADLGPGLSTSISYDNFVVRVAPVLAAARQQTATALAARSTATQQAVQAAATAHAQWPLVLTDTFAANVNGWPSGRSNTTLGTVDRQIGGGVYRWTAHTDKGILLTYRPRSDPLSDFSVAVDAQLISGTLSTLYGLAFRDDGSSQYLFSVSDDQLYRLFVYTGGSWTTLIAASHSDAIRPGQINRLGVDAAGVHLSLTINGQFVAALDDSTLSSGQVALSLEVAAANDAVVEFSNFELRGLPAPTPAATRPRPTATPTRLPATATATLMPATATAIALQVAAQATAAAANVAATLDARQAQAAHTQWPLVFTDTFATNANGWPLDATSAGFGPMQATLAGGAYRWQAKALQTASWTAAPPSLAPPALAPLTNFALTVDTLLSATSPARAGVYFRKSGENYYLFELRGDGTFVFARHTAAAVSRRSSAASAAPSCATSQTGSPSWPKARASPSTSTATRSPKATTTNSPPPAPSASACRSPPATPPPSSSPTSSSAPRPNVD